MRTWKHLGLAAAAMAALSACGGGQREIPEAAVAAESSAVFGEYTVFFNALSTDEVPADVAQSVGIVRARNRALLNVSVRHNERNEAVEATVEVAAENLTGQLKNMTMRKVEQGDAIYYLGEVSVANRETLIYTISVTPSGETEPFQVRTKRIYHTD